MRRIIALGDEHVPHHVYACDRCNRTAPPTVAMGGLPPGWVGAFFDGDEFQLCGWACLGIYADNRAMEEIEAAEVGKSLGAGPRVERCRRCGTQVIREPLTWYGYVDRYGSLLDFCSLRCITEYAADEDTTLAMATEKIP